MCAPTFLGGAYGGGSPDRLASIRGNRCVLLAFSNLGNWVKTLWLVDEGQPRAVVVVPEKYDAQTGAAASPATYEPSTSIDAKTSPTALPSTSG